MKIGVVCPVINNWSKYTKPMLDSVKSGHQLYFVIVDNMSNDETFTEATKLITQDFHYKRNPDNWGCSRSWNYGLQDCFINHGCDYVLVTNNDVLFHPKAIDRLVERFEEETVISTGFSDDERMNVYGKDDDLVMVTCMNVKGDCQNIPDNIFKLDAKGWATTEESEHPDFSGFMVNRDFIERVGYFDEAYSDIGGAYFEDNDQHRRIKLAKAKAINCPQALFYHHGSGSRREGKITLPMNYRFESNRDYFVAKWGGMPDSPGLWDNPFNDPKKDWKWTLQSEPKDVQSETVSRYKKV